MSLAFELWRGVIGDYKLSEFWLIAEATAFKAGVFVFQFAHI